MELAGEPRFDAAARFTGFRGTALPPGKAAAAETAPTLSDPAFGSLPLSDPAFGRRIDGALRGPLHRIIPPPHPIYRPLLRTTLSHYPPFSRVFLSHYGNCLGRDYCS